MKKIFLLGLTITILNLGCELTTSGLDPLDITQTSIETYAADEVKLISPDIRSYNDSTASQQYEYEISDSSRLLMRLDVMMKIATEMLAEQPVILRIAPHNRTAMADARQNLRLCPLTANWMMYATWSKAHPYTNGKWTTPGGDYDPRGCLQAIPTNSTLLDNNDEKSFCQDDTYLCFDIRGHLRSYVRSRKVNYGWVLVSDVPVWIYGDHAAYGPEVHYRKFRY